MEGDCFFNEKYKAVYKTLGEIELALLLCHLSVYEDEQKDWQRCLLEFFEEMEESQRRKITELSEKIEYTL